MNRFITEELKRIQLLSNYDNSKTLSEQQISKREQQLNNYYTKNSSNVKQIQTKLQELRLDIGASNPDGILGKKTLESILFVLNAYQPTSGTSQSVGASILKGGSSELNNDSKQSTGENPTTDSFGKGIFSGVKQSTGENPTVASTNQSDNETLPNAKVKDMRRVDAQNSI
jgi:hypothetical protein